MRASVFIATSLDGYIARSNGSVDFLPQDGGEPHGFTEFYDSVDAVLIGRKTFEWVLAYGQWVYGTKPVVVLSSQPWALKAPEGAVCEFMEGTPAQVVDRLSRKGWQHVYVDGGVTIQGFLEAGLIQKMTITRVPVLLGSGIPLFGALSRDVGLRHVGTRSFPSGLVTSEYDVLLK
jgi:dihydrofolate reductase